MWQDPTIRGLLILVAKIAAVLGTLMGFVAYTVLLERRVAAWIQDRRGPNRVGWAGILQPIADGAKLLLKENVLPSFVRKSFFILAPTLVLAPPLLVVGLLPWGSNLVLPLPGETLKVACVLADPGVGLLFVYAVGALAVYGIALAGWASRSKYALLGGVRSAAQLISYEVCMGVGLLGIVMQTGSLNLSQIVAYQTQHGWLVLYQPVGFLICLVSLFAETNRLPFDFPEAEQELVAGYHTEYSSMKFGLFFMGEYASVLVGSGLMVTLFFGGWSLPFGALAAPADSLALSLAHIGIFLAKTFLITFFFIWVRWTLPRFRYDQLMRLGWTGLLPIGLANLALVALVMAFR